MVVVERSSMSTASAGTWRLSVRYRRIDSASDTTSSLPCPPEATNTPVLPCFSHNGRRQQRRQRRQRHAEIHSGLPHQSSSSRRCAETRHYTAEPAAIPLTPAAIHHRLFPRHVRCPIIVDLPYSHASGTLPQPHACTVQEGFPYGTELSRVAGNRHRDHRVRPQARCDPDHHRVRRGDCARRRHHSQGQRHDRHHRVRRGHDAVHDDHGQRVRRDHRDDRGHRRAIRARLWRPTSTSCPLRCST